MPGEQVDLSLSKVRGVRKQQMSLSITNPTLRIMHKLVQSCDVIIKSNPNSLSLGGKLVMFLASTSVAVRIAF